MTTQLVTLSRSTAAPRFMSSCNFDKPFDTCGWRTDYSNFAWSQTNGNMSSFFDFLGPGSDWTSISTLTSGQTPAKQCAIPYCYYENGSFVEELFYCKKYPLKRAFQCGLNACPAPSSFDANAFGTCNMGFYLMALRENFATTGSSFRSRLFSPVFRLRPSTASICVTFRYNILTTMNKTSEENGDEGEGLNFLVEDYLEPLRWLNLFNAHGFLANKWHSATIQLVNIKLDQFRVSDLIKI